MKEREDLEDDPVVAACLARDGVAVADLDWRVTLIWADDGHEVAGAHHEGTCVMDLKLHRDATAVWFASVQLGEAVSYHAQRGRRSITLRAEIPDTVLAQMVGRTADAIADVPGFERLTIAAVRPSPGAPTDIVIAPLGA